MEEKTKPQARTRDLGKGSIPKLLAQLAIPVVVAQIVNLLYNICRPNLHRTYSRNRCGSAYWCWLVCTNFNADKRVCYAVWFRRSTKSSNIHGKEGQ